MINKLIFDEQSVTDPQEIADALNDHFVLQVKDSLTNYPIMGMSPRNILHIT